MIWGFEKVGVDLMVWQFGDLIMGKQAWGFEKVLPFEFILRSQFSINQNYIERLRLQPDHFDQHAFCYPVFPLHAI